MRMKKTLPKQMVPLILSNQYSEIDRIVPDLLKLDIDYLVDRILAAILQSPTRY